MPQCNKGEDFGKKAFTRGHHCLHPRWSRKRTDPSPLLPLKSTRCALRWRVKA